MTIQKIVNNNVVIVSDRKKGEMVVMGSGLGFQKRPGQRVDKSKIEKTFILAHNPKLNQRLIEIPLVYLGICEDIVEYAQQQYHLKINHSIYLGLMDHMYYAVSRIKENLLLDNPLAQDVKHFYKDFWDIGCFGARRIKDIIGVEVPDDEIGYIALHVMEASHQHCYQRIKEIDHLKILILQMIQENGCILKDTFAYERLERHVKYFANRYLSDQEVHENDIVFNSQIENLFGEEKECIEKISQFLSQKFGREMSASEKNYLILHLRQCKNMKR